MIRVKLTLLLNHLPEQESTSQRMVIKTTSQTDKLVLDSIMFLKILKSLHQMTRKKVRLTLLLNHFLEQESINLKTVIKITSQTDKLAQDSIKKIQKARKRNQYGGQIHTAMGHKTTSMSQIGALVNNLHKMNQIGLSIIDGHTLTET
jgi:hypothetical protein